MKRASRRVAASLCLAAALAAGVGCGPGKAPEPTPAEYFQKHQGATETTHGRIDLGSVREAGGQIEYRTADGKTWRVGHSKRPDGTYQYGTPEEVKSAPAPAGP